MKNKVFRVSNIVLAALIVGVFAFSVMLPDDDGVQAYAPIYSGNNENAVSLMVNVYGGDEYLFEMLDIFKQNKVKTTFFVGGTWAQKNPESLLAIFADGHEIGNHGYFHKDHKKLSAKNNKSEIVACHNLVKSLTTYDMHLFAPPSGSFSETTLKVAQDCGYATVMWSRDTIDWRDQDVDLIVKRATEKTKGGDLVLMHPTKASVAALGKIIDALKAKGLSVSTVSEILNQV